MGKERVAFLSHGKGRLNVRDAGIGLESRGDFYSGAARASCFREGTTHSEGSRHIHTNLSCILVWYWFTRVRKPHAG